VAVQSQITASSVPSERAWRGEGFHQEKRGLKKGGTKTLKFELLQIRIERVTLSIGGQIKLRKRRSCHFLYENENRRKGRVADGAPAPPYRPCLPDTSSQWKTKRQITNAHNE